MTRTRWLVCALCGKTDKTTPGHVGTSQEMRCDTCGGSEQAAGSAGAMLRRVFCATRCRDCCPTGHHTRYRDPILVGERSLGQVLAECELEARASKDDMMSVDVLDGRRVVFKGSQFAVWAWLRATNRVERLGDEP